jgi:pimeloyl-ACP methyl ester carboxylesterase
MPLSEPLVRWRRRGAFARIRDLDVFHVVEGEGPSTLVVLHGFPTSSFDWSAALPALAARHRVVLFDLPGYGLSSKPRIYSYSLLEQCDIALELLARNGVTSAHLVAHDMGASVLCEMLARREDGTLPLEVRSITVINAGLHLELARQTPAQRALRRPLLGRVFARLASRATFKLQFRRLFGRPDAVPAEELDQLWELLAYDDGAARLPQLIRYMEERAQRAARWLPPLVRLDVPTLVLWGQRDPVAVFAIAEKLARDVPGARLIELEALGHYPQIEDPARVADAITSFAAGVDAVQPASPRP